MHPFCTGAFLVHFRPSARPLAPHFIPYIRSSHRLTLNSKRWFRIVKVHNPFDLATPWCSAPFKAHTTVLWRCGHGARQRKEPRKIGVWLWTTHCFRRGQLIASAVWTCLAPRPRVVSNANERWKCINGNLAYNFHWPSLRPLAGVGGVSPRPRPLYLPGIQTFVPRNPNARNRHIKFPLMRCIERA